MFDIDIRAFRTVSEPQSHAGKAHKRVIQEVDILGAPSDDDVGAVCALVGGEAKTVDGNLDALPGAVEEQLKVDGYAAEAGGGFCAVGDDVETVASVGGGNAEIAADAEWTDVLQR